MSFALAAAALLPALLATGCSNAADETDGDTSTVAANGKAVEFAECMRDNGVAEFPDPDGKGELTIDGVVNSSGIDSDGPAWQKAIDACQDLQPPGFTGPESTPERQAQVLEFAECIRENGVPDFPDPEPDGPPVDTNRIPSAATEAGMSALNAAMHACPGIIDGTDGP